MVSLSLSDSERIAVFWPACWPPGGQEAEFTPGLAHASLGVAWVGAGLQQRCAKLAEAKALASQNGTRKAMAVASESGVV